MTATCEDDCIDTEEDVPLLQLGPEHGGGIVHVIDDKKAKKALGAQKRIIFMGVLMTIYSLAEIGLSLKVNSLVVFSDGLHNLSDAIALAIALWAERAQLKAASDSMTFGWRRAETVGGFVNSLFVLAMGVFVLLQAIPDFLDPKTISHVEALYFIIVAGVGILLNIIGAFVFAGHGHGHSHGGGGGGHGHSKSAASVNGNHGHEHDHGHGHSKGDDGHGHAHNHGHSHDSGDVRPRSTSPESTASSSGAPESHGHSHSKDHNSWALFLHFVGDVLTSMLVLAVGLLCYYFDEQTHHWVYYTDPAASILSSFILLGTAWPVLKACYFIFLQSTPSHLDVQGLRAEILRVSGVYGIHHVHYWQLVDGLTVCTMHMLIAQGDNWEQISSRVRSVLHRHGVHSSTIQPEFVETPDTETNCENFGNCIPSCGQEQCC